MSDFNRLKQASIRMAAKVAVGTAVAGLTVAGVGTAAWAAPTNAKNAFPITLSCDNGQSYNAVINGGGSDNSQSGQTFNPAHVLDGNSVLIPVSFGESIYTLYDNGTQVFQQSQPASAKGNGNATGPANATLATCSYTFSQSQVDPTTGDTYTMTGSGTVTGFIPGSQAKH